VADALAFAVPIEVAPCGPETLQVTVPPPSPVRTAAENTTDPLRVEVVGVMSSTIGVLVAGVHVKVNDCVWVTVVGGGSTGRTP
jgi:hypothetical protein